MLEQELRNSRLTHSQLQIWIGQRLNPESPLYNMAFAMLFLAELRADLFQQAWQRVVDDSDALRTYVQERGGVGVRRLRERGLDATELLDFRRHPDPPCDFRRWCRRRCAEPLPTDGGLVDSVLVRLGDDLTGWYLNQHHLIADAWSTVLVYRQVAAEYEHLLGETDRRPTLQPYYATAAALDASPAAREAALAHWATRREHGARSTPFYGRESKPVGTASARMTLELDESRSRGLDRLTAEPGFASLSADTSRFATFATLLSSWLYRISGECDLGFDAPIGGRPTADAKRSIGLFIEMFPFAVTVEPQDTFRSLGARCLEEAGLFLRHALPRASAPSGDSASNVVLNYFPEAFGDFAGLPVDVEWVHPGHGDDVHALRLQVHDFSGSGRYTLHFDFNEQVLPERLRRRSVAHFEALLAAMLQDPDRVIAAVDVSTEEEREALADLNATDALPLPDETVVAMFERQAAATPDLVALRQGRKEVSFLRLRQESEALAAALVERGVEPGDRVAILAPRSTLAVTGILAALRAGAAYVPIDPSYPSARIDRIVSDSGARFILSAEHDPHRASTESKLPMTASPAPRRAPSPRIPGATALRIEDEIRAGTGRSLERPGPGLEDLAYLIYTSGSTGRPKGVPIEHGGLADYLQWASRRYVRGDRLAFPLFTSLSFDLTITSLFLPLITGGTLEIYPEPEGPLDSAVMDVIDANRVDFIKLTPSHLSLLRQVDLSASRIRRIVVGGEDFLTHLAATIGSQFGDVVEIDNEYGPTEAIVGCIAHRYDPSVDVDTRVPIGAPADHVDVRILNEASSPVPEGAPGELWISRFGMARGYHGLAEITAERFLFDPESEKTFYRTGDRVRLAAPDRLEYLGRLDRQVKISGFRIEPGEVEAAVLSFDGIEQCAVVAHQRERSPAAVSADDLVYCARCGLPSNFPGAELDDNDICSVCHAYESIAEYAQGYFKTMGELKLLFDESRRKQASEHDCLMLLSGGKDSTYALCKLVEMGLSVHAFTLDNGFISEGAIANIRRVTEQLGVPLEIASTPAMNAIFRDSLMRFSNVCHGCFKTIYTLSMMRARALGIPIIVTGLSRGQMFETRLTEEMFRDGRCSPEEVDAAVLAARKVYHRVDDEVSRSLDVGIFADDRVFEQIRFVDFYRYCDADLDEVLSYLDSRVPWVRPADTGRSTNCLINDAGIYIHKKERGFHNYALPYSWDVRLGQKTRNAALDELDDELDTEQIRGILEQVGYDENRLAGSSHPHLAAYYVAANEISEAALRRHLGEFLPSQFVPASLQRLDSIPLTANGKIDEAALPSPESGEPADVPFVPPYGPVQEYLAGVWREQLGVQRVGADHDFFELGGTSLAAMEVMIRLCREFDIDLPLETLFTHPTLGGLAAVAEQRILDDLAEMDGTVSG